MMEFRVRMLTALLLLSAAAPAEAEVLIRWNQDRMPSPQSLGIATLVIPADNTIAVQNAVAQGYRVYVEVPSGALATFTPPDGALAGIVVKGNASPEQLLQLGQRLKSPGLRVLALEERGKWPHIRSNSVRKNNDVLQVAGRSVQPWIESNAALIRIAEATHPAPPLLAYNWTPVTLVDVDEGPALEDYLVAIAEAGSFGADLLLPLHERFQRNLLVGQPQARADWNEIRRNLEFYERDLRRTYRPIANIGVVTANPMPWFEVMNLLARHNLPFELLAPAQLASRSLDAFDLLIVLDEPQGAEGETLAAFARKGRTVVRKAAADPNAFALEIRQMLGRERRAIDIWNGITVIAAPYREPNGPAVLVTALNYAHQPLPVQLRVRGTFSMVHYESPEEPRTLLQHEHRDGYTEFVLPSLRIGGRVFLSRQP